MKKTLLSFATILNFGLIAQTLTQANHAPAAGDAFKRIQCDSTGVAPGASGAGQNWNFSSLIIHSTITTTYVASTSSNATYNPSDVVMKELKNADNAYFKSSASDLKTYGGNFLSGNISVSLTYTAPAVLATYPMNLNSANSSATGGTISLNNSFTGNFFGTASFVADATGTLALPAKTFTDVIKVTSSQLINATLSVGTVTVTQLNFNYYSIGTSKSPILSISTSTAGSSLAATSSQTIVTVLKDYATVGVNELSKNAIELTVFPNPASSTINFNTTSQEAYQVAIYDLTGKMITNELFEKGHIKTSISSLSNGNYFYVVADKAAQILTTGKFTVSK